MMSFGNKIAVYIGMAMLIAALTGLVVATVYFYGFFEPVVTLLKTFAG